MKTMFFSGKYIPLKILLRSYCPLMLREKYESGKNWKNEDVVCRCDVVPQKKAFGFGQCRSGEGCPVRKHPLFRESAICLHYEIL